MLIFPPPERHQKRIKPRLKPPPRALSLVRATYDASGPRVILTFDRAIDVTGIDVGQFRVLDGVTSFRNYYGSGVPTLDDPATMRLSLTELGATGAGSVTLTVLDENGIKAVDDGGTWGGVDELALPFTA
jgi:hypothetical protein